MPCCLVCSMQPCAHLLGKGWPFGSPVCDDFLCFFSLSHMVSWVGCGIWLYRFLIFGFFLTIIIVALFLIKSLKRSGETYCLCSVSSYYFSTSSISSFSFHQNFVWMSLSNYWMDCSEIWGYGRYGCEVVQEGFKMSGSTASPWVCPKPLIFCPDYFSLAIEAIVLNFVYDKYWNIVLQESLTFEIPDSRADQDAMPGQTSFKVLNISDTIQIPSHKP